MQRRTANLMALAALAAAAAPFPAAAKEKSSEAEISFASPEAVVDHILSALREADLRAALPAFAIDRRARDYSFVKMAVRLNSISLHNVAPPTGFAFYRDIAVAQFTSEAATQLRNLAYSLLVPSGTPLDTIIAFSDGQDIGQFASDLEAALDPARLANLRVLQTKAPVPEAANSAIHRRNIAAQLAVTGGDDLQERLVLYEIDGRTYMAGLTLVRYGDAWQVRTMMAALGGTRASGHAVPMTAEEFAATMN